MLCKGCRYSLTGLDTLRCPECGLAFDPDDASTLYRPKRDPRSILLRAALTLLVLGMWYATTMTKASANTSWEHHPFAGAFIIVKESLRESHSFADWALALFVWACFLGMVSYWVISGKVWAAVVVIALCAATIVLSSMAASSASC